MKIKETYSYHGEEPSEVSHISITLYTDYSTQSISIGEGEPEDMYLFRDLSDAYHIADAIRLAYEAGRRGEEFEYEFIEDKDED